MSTTPYFVEYTPVTPDGWRKLSTREHIKAGDLRAGVRFWAEVRSPSKYIPCPTRGETYIRRIK